MAELVTSDVIDRTESLNLLFDEKNRTKMSFGLSYTANKVRIFPNVYLCAYFNFK